MRHVLGAIIDVVGDDKGARSEAVLHQAHQSFAPACKAAGWSLARLGVKNLSGARRGRGNRSCFASGVSVRSDESSVTAGLVAGDSASASSYNRSNRGASGAVVRVVKAVSIMFVVVIR